MTATPLGEFRAIIGAAHVLTGAEDVARYASDERRLYHGHPLAVVRPGNASEVAALVRICAQRSLSMVPQGGNTGYCGGATPDTSGTQVVISLERLDRIIAVNREAYTMTLEAGVVLAQAQAAAAAHGLLLPLSMGSQDSCQIGGNLSTNAGGLAVLKFGTARELVLGLQVVLPDGRIYDKLAGLRKDNTGYDLKQLFLGAEGTLGIITAAVLKLFANTPRATAWVAVLDCAAACALLAHLRQTTGDNVTSFEYMTPAALEHVARALPKLKVPLDLTPSHHVLVECQSGDDGALERALTEAAARGLLADAVLATSSSQARALWQVREAIPAAEKLLGGSIKHDVAVAIGDMPRYIEQASAGVRARWPTARLSVYGHIGDGNVHFNVLAPLQADGADFKAGQGAAISALVHDLAHDMGGSFSAEHGVGQLKRDLLQHYTDAVSLDLMRAIKSTLDPRGLMNPGKVLPDDIA